MRQSSIFNSKIINTVLALSFLAISVGCSGGGPATVSVGTGTSAENATLILYRKPKFADFAANLVIRLNDE